MTPAQRARRIRQINDRRAALAVEDRRLEAELRPLESQESRSLGIFVPLRGSTLLQEMDRRDAKVAAQAEAA